MGTMDNTMAALRRPAATRLFPNFLKLFMFSPLFYHSLESCMVLLRNAAFHTCCLAFASFRSPRREEQFPDRNNQGN